MEIDLKHLEYLSKLQIDVQDEEKFKTDFKNILSFVDEITKLDLPEEDKRDSVDLQQLREDEHKSDVHCDVLMNAPKKKDGCYLTPLVVE